MFTLLTVGAAVLSAVSFAVFAAFDIAGLFQDPDQGPVWDWQWFTLASGLFFMLAVGVLLVRQERRIHLLTAASPSIRFDSGQCKQLNPPNGPWVLEAWFKNHPKMPVPSSHATDVAARVRVLDEYDPDIQLFEFQGLWLGSTGADNVGFSSVSETTSIAPNGLAVKLGICHKRAGQGTAYGLNQYTIVKFQELDAYSIPAGARELVIELLGTGVRETYRLCLKNRGANVTHMDIEPVPDKTLRSRFRNQISILKAWRMNQFF